MLKLSQFLILGLSFLLCILWVEGHSGSIDLIQIIGLIIFAQALGVVDGYSR